MCGILALLLNDDGTLDEEIDDLSRLLSLIDSRGPDYSSQLIEHSMLNGPRFKFKSSILHLRGETMQVQPLMDGDGNVLLFNGQIYEHSGNAIDRFQSDTDYLLNELSRCQSPQQIAETFSEIDGPFAIIFWHHRFRKLFYGRDVFGRKSLCVLRSKESCPLIISSVIDATLERPDRKWSEVRCDGIHCIDYNTYQVPVELIFPWDLDSIYLKTEKCDNVPDIPPGGPRLMMSQLKPLNLDPTEPNSFSDSARQSAIEEFESKFVRAVKSRYQFNRKDCLTCRRDPKYSAITKEIICRESKVAVAFSGGIDSTMIAMALHRVMDIKETIDLVTVAFKDESPDREAVGSAFEELRSLCRLRTWRLVICDVSKLELQTEREHVIRDLILPCDTIFDDGLGCASWFVGRAKGRAIDSKFSDEWMTNHFEEFLKYNPSNTNLDDQVTIEYKSPASMMFVGSSIDEQLGGYSSHRKVWTQERILGLNKEISRLMRRISWRNLGRDDRVYCHHGRDLKVPFLDPQFVSFLNELPIGLKMNLDEPTDIGPKKILRELALRWGLDQTGRRVKRAMQFGTRIANLERTKENANDVCTRLKPLITNQVPILIDLTGD